MSAQMRKVLMALGVVVVAALLWVALVGPAREDRDAAQAARQQAETRASQVAGQLAAAKEAAARAPENEDTLKRLAIAVPEKVEAPALIDGLDSTARRYGVTFDVLKVTNGAASAAPVAAATGTTTGATTTAAPATTTGTPAGVAADGSAVPGTAGTAAAPAGSVPVELNIEIAGRYTGVTKFLKSIQSEVRVRPNGRLSAKGRLLRVGSVDLQSADGATSGGRRLKGTLAVTAYLLPKDGAATAAATTTAPATGVTQP